MNTENMPTTNQGPEDTTLADKIPSTVAEGFDKAASALGNYAIGEAQKGSQSWSNA